MPGIGINGMGPPPRRYRLEGLANFETVVSARKEDGSRGGLLAVHAVSGNRHNRRAFRSLKEKPGRSDAANPCRSGIARRILDNRICFGCTSGEPQSNCNVVPAPGKRLSQCLIRWHNYAAAMADLSDEASNQPNNFSLRNGKWTIYVLDK